MKITNILIIQFFIIIYIVFTLFVSKYYKGGFSQTLTGNVIMSVLIVFMIISLKQYRMLLILFLFVLFVSTNDYIRENFSDYLKSELKGVQEENKYLNREISAMKKDNENLKETVQEQKREVAAVQGEIKSQEMQHAQDNATTEAIKEEQSKGNCDRAFQLWKEKENYPSDVQRTYKEQIKKCANIAEPYTNRSSSNLVKLNHKNNNSNLKHMIDNFKNINNPLNSLSQGPKYNDRIGIESSLIPVNTRYFN